MSGVSRSLKRAKAADFLRCDAEAWSKQLVGELVSSGFSTEATTLRSYKASIEALKVAFEELAERYPSSAEWDLLFEFQLLRRQRRLDLVILAADRIIVIEFKTGSSGAGKDAQIQVEDYAFDLRDFHEPSHGRLILPLVVGARLIRESWDIVRPEGSHVAITITVDPSQLALALEKAAKIANPFERDPIDPMKWEIGRYSPVPPILDAALHLFRNHEVQDIASCSAGSDNLTFTVDAIKEIITTAQATEQRTICFVTGVPGSGKTLAGLTAVHAADGSGLQHNATFLSGNIPLVNVLREALIRDSVKIDKKKRPEAARYVNTFIEPMQAFVAEYAKGDTLNPPTNRIVVFDEAQRAWDQSRMSQKKGIDKSEPEILLEIMGRHKDAVMIALVGGGQEIHSGEAGLKGWGDALKADPRWKILASPEVIAGSDLVGGSKLFPDEAGDANLEQRSSLHLSVSRRSIKSSNWNQWVEAFLRGDLEHAYVLASQLEGFDVKVTRDLAKARAWLHLRSRGTRRCGLISSSGNLRGRAFGIEVSSGFKSGIDWPSWFLNGEADIRSSSYLEIPATEFECQGLEIDEVGLCWGGDFLPANQDAPWRFQSFRGSKWVNARGDSQQFIISKYRVLLTRARTGIVIWVPERIPDDNTIDDDGFELLYDRFLRAGIGSL